jgi:hypothetical protein
MLTCEALTKALVVCITAGLELWHESFEELVEDNAICWPASILSGLQLLELVRCFALLGCRCKKTVIKGRPLQQRRTNDSRKCKQVAF